MLLGILEFLAHNFSTSFLKVYKCKSHCNSDFHKDVEYRVGPSEWTRAANNEASIWGVCKWLCRTLLRLSLKHFLEKLHYPLFAKESKFWKVVLNSPRSSIVQLYHSDLILMQFIKSSKLCLQRTLCCLFNQDKENGHSLQERLLWEEAKMNTTCQGGCIQTPWTADLHPKN